MLGKIITAAFVIVIVAFVIFVLKDSNGGVQYKELLGKVIKIPRKTELYNGPDLYVRYKDGEEYKKYKVNKTNFTIGRGSGCDLCIDFPYFGEKQASIRKTRYEGEVYYSFVNYGKVNSTEYYNKDTDTFEWMEYKDEVLLERRDVFYVGDVKMLIVTPVLKRKSRASDREVSKVVNSKTATTARRTTDRVPKYDDVKDNL